MYDGGRFQNTSPHPRIKITPKLPPTSVGYFINGTNAVKLSISRSELYFDTPHIKDVLGIMLYPPLKVFKSPSVHKNEHSSGKWYKL